MMIWVERLGYGLRFCVVVLVVISFVWFVFLHRFCGFPDTWGMQIVMFCFGSGYFAYSLLVANGCFVWLLVLCL